jgi:hypothetical protein
VERAQAGNLFSPAAAAAAALHQGCQMVYFQTKKCNLGKFCRALQWKMLVYFMDVVSILRPFERFYDSLVYFVAIWYIFPRVGILHQEKIWQPCIAQGKSRTKWRVRGSA